MVTWNEFRNQHKGLQQSEISKLWAQYKAGEYDIPRGIEADELEQTEEVQRDEEEIEALDSNELTAEEEFTAKMKVAEMVEKENPNLLKDGSPSKDETVSKIFLGLL